MESDISFFTRGAESVSQSLLQGFADFPCGALSVRSWITAVHSGWGRILECGQTGLHFRGHRYRFDPDFEKQFAESRGDKPARIINMFGSFPRARGR
jgi:hypothetical protein